MENIDSNDNVDDTTNDHSSHSSATEILEDKETEIQEEKEITKNNDVPITKEDTSNKQETTNNQKVNEKENNYEIDSSSNISSDNNSDNNVIDNIPIEEEQEIVVPEEDSTPQVDTEYERLKSLIKYKTDVECYDASFNVSMNYIDDENFKVISCVSFAYKGELLGYRMVVHYWDGTTEYLDAIG